MFKLCFNSSQNIRDTRKFKKEVKKIEKLESNCKNGCQCEIPFYKNLDNNHKHELGEYFREKGCEITGNDSTGYYINFYYLLFQ